MIRDAVDQDLFSIVEIYNAAIPGRLATADVEPVSVDSRRVWFAEHDAGHRPLWVYERDGAIAGWISLGVFYDRPAYHATAEVSVYVHPAHHRQGIASALLREAVARAPALGLRTLMGFVFAHNAPSLALFGRLGFERWGHLPEVCEMDGVRRDVLLLGRTIQG